MSDYTDFSDWDDDDPIEELLHEWDADDLGVTFDDDDDDIFTEV